MTRDVVSVVAGGYSVREADLSRIPGLIVAVNDAAVYLPRVDVVVSMDRVWAENRKDSILHVWKRVLLRDVATKLPELRSAPSVELYACDNESVAFSLTQDRLNGTNSGTVALNLAYVLQPKTLYLFGFDMCRGPSDEAHWYPDYSWNPTATKQGKLKEWASQFDAIARQFKFRGIDVVNVSSRSRVTQFRRVTAQEIGIGRRDVA